VRRCELARPPPGGAGVASPQTFPRPSYNFLLSWRCYMQPKQIEEEEVGGGGGGGGGGKRRKENAVPFSLCCNELNKSTMAGMIQRILLDLFHEIEKREREREREKEK